MLTERVAPQLEFLWETRFPRRTPTSPSGFFVSLPYVAAFFGVVLAGFLSDLMIRRGVSLSVARKGPIVAGLLLSIVIIGANFTDNIVLITVIMSVAFFGNGFASITWSLVSSIAPQRLLGTTGGTFNFVGNISSIATPILIGFLVSDTNFAPAIIYIAVVTVIGIIAFIAMIGKVERLPDPADAGGAEKTFSSQLVEP